MVRWRVLDGEPSLRGKLDLPREKPFLDAAWRGDYQHLEALMDRSSVLALLSGALLVSFWGSVLGAGSSAWNFYEKRGVPGCGKQLQNTVRYILVSLASGFGALAFALASTLTSK